MKLPAEASHVHRAAHRCLFEPVLAIALLLASAPSSAYSDDFLEDDSLDARRACERQHAVRIGNAGKDVIWVPTHDKLVTAMLSAAGTGPDDYVIDLGAGDGKIPIAAAREFGASALGIEYDARMVELAQCYVRAEQLTHKVEIRQADIFRQDFSRATVLTMYLLPELNMKLRPMLLALSPGTRILSNRFKLGQWQPDERISVDGVANQAYLWIVPAQISGLWRFDQRSGTGSFRVRLRQEFQNVRGTVLGKNRGALRGKLRGTYLELLVPLRRKMRFQGQVENGQITLVAKDMTLSEDRGASDIFVGRRE